MNRLEGWEKRLADHIDDARGKAFDWESHNCWLFAAGAILAITGVDAGKAYRGPKTMGGFLRRFHRLGGVEAAMKDWPKQPIKSTRRGDVVVVRPPEGEDVFGVCTGKYAVCLLKTGIAHRPMKCAISSWRVG
jgi:hypothetical protein